MNLADARAIVTGAASGMGLHFARRFAELGGHVLAVDINEDALAHVADELDDAAARVHTCVADVSDEASVVAMITEAESAMGVPNVLVNNAGLFRDQLLVKKDKRTGDVKTMSLDAWQKVIDVDLTGPFLCTREFAKRCVETDTKPAVIVNISSVSRHGNPGQSNYSAAKAGLIADTKLWALEMARYGIRVGAVAPGFVKTPILEGMREDVLGAMLKGVALRRVGDPEEIWLGVKFIVECDYFTGRCIDIDGGLSM